MLGTEITTKPSDTRARPSSTRTRSGSMRCSRTSPYRIASNGPPTSGISRLRLAVSIRSQYRAPTSASAGSPSTPVTRQPRSVSRRLTIPSAAPTSRIRRPRPSPSHLRITEWLLCGSGLRTYRGIFALTPLLSSDVHASVGKIRVQPAPARLREEPDATRRQGTHYAPLGRHGREEEVPPGHDPCRLEAGRRPEDVARLREARAEREGGRQPVHHMDRAGQAHERRGAVLEGALVHDEIARARTLRER